MTYVLCEVLGWGGVWVSEERRRIADVETGISAYLDLPYSFRWLWAAAKTLVEKKYITRGELTDRLVEVQGRYSEASKGSSRMLSPSLTRQIEC